MATVEKEEEEQEEKDKDELTPRGEWRGHGEDSGRYEGFVGRGRGVAGLQTVVEEE